MPHLRGPERSGGRSVHRAVQDADQLDMFIDRILAGHSVESHEVPRRLRALVAVTKLLASQRLRRGR